MVLACWRAADEPVTGRLDPALLRVVAERPDSIVGILIRTAAPPTPAQLAAITARGVRVGSAADTLVTGQARARDAARLVELEFVVHIQLATTLRPTEP
jgi:hypothetical protein